MKFSRRTNLLDMKVLATMYSICLVITAFGQTSPDFTKAKAIINDYISNKNFPSISIAVVKEGKIIWEEGFGYADIENKRKATSSTPYYIASITKTMTATALMKMTEQGLINLDSPVNKYLKRWQVTSYRWHASAATVKSVMSHTSGLTTFNFWCRTDSLTCANMDDEVMSRYAKLLSTPGHFDYSNIGYGVLDHLIRDVSGVTYTEYMRREIFQPLGMNDTFVACNPLPAGVAISYTGVPGSDPVLADYPHSHTYCAGASTVYSSVHDLALFAMLHLGDLKMNAVITGGSVKTMQDTVARIGSGYYGLAWWIDMDYNGYKGLLAQGGTWNAQAWMELIPSEDVAVIVVGNKGDGSPYRAIIDDVLTELLPEFKANMIAESQLPKPEKLSTKEPEPPASKWKGVVKTYKGDIPVVFNFNGSTTSTADFGSVKNIRLSDVRLSPNSYSYRIEGDLKLDDMGRPPYNMNFYLTQEGDELYGSVQTASSVHPDTPTLSFWVEMKRLE
jgi:CubicO group peptidase (beta-lactamase class C family)